MVTSLSTSPQVASEGQAVARVATTQLAVLAVAQVAASQPAGQLAVAEPQIAARVATWLSGRQAVVEFQTPAQVAMLRSTWQSADPQVAARAASEQSSGSLAVAEPLAAVRFRGRERQAQVNRNWG